MQEGQAFVASVGKLRQDLGHGDEGMQRSWRLGLQTSVSPPCGGASRGDRQQVQGVLPEVAYGPL